MDLSAIEISSLRKYYGKTRGLENATLEVKEGEIYGFVGPNGSGKTTLTRILLGLIHSNSGEAKIFDQDVKKASVELNKEIGYLPSEAFFFPEMKVKDVLRFFQEMRKVDDSRVLELVDRFDIDVNKSIDQLSFGNKKKIGIVVALLHSPRLLILDEPTTGLDPLMQQTFLDLLVEEKKKGVTVFLSSHILSEVEKICDRVALIRDGVIYQVFEMSEIAQLENKKVSLFPALEGNLPKGMTFIKVEDDLTHYSYVGDINLLLKRLSQQRFDKCTIRDASLEEIFIQYYQKEGVSHDVL